MTFDEALNLLLLHSFAHQQADYPGMEAGFLGMLRPYHGLHEGNFHQVMQVLQALAPHLRSTPHLDRQLVAALWGLCHYARAWGLEPNGMLQRNHLISPSDTKRLDTWISIISDSISNLLDGADDEVAFEAYQWHMHDSPSM